MTRIEEKTGVTEFAAPWGTLLKGISGFTTVLLCGLSVGVWFTPGVPALRTWWLSALPLLILLISGAFTVRGYQLGPGVLYIRRLAWKTRLDLSGLQGVESVPQVMRHSIRLFGNGGLFSFTGWFRNAQLGTYRAYVTDFHRGVVLRFEKRSVVVSPEDPTQFVAALQPALARHSPSNNIPL